MPNAWMYLYCRYSDAKGTSIRADWLSPAWPVRGYSVAIAVSMSRRAARRAGPMLASTPAAAVARM